MKAMTQTGLALIASLFAVGGCGTTDSVETDSGQSTGGGGQSTTGGSDRCVGTIDADGYDDSASCYAQGGIWRVNRGGTSYCEINVTECRGSSQGECVQQIGCGWRLDDESLAMHPLLGYRCEGTVLPCEQVTTRCIDEPGCVGDSSAGTCERSSFVACSNWQGDGTYVHPDIAKLRCEKRTGCSWIAP